MTQGLEKKHSNRCGYHLRNMVNEKRDRGLIVAILRFCHITINYINFLDKRVVQHIKHHTISCLSNRYDPKLVRTTHYSHCSDYMEPLEHTVSAQIAKYPKLVIIWLSQTTENAKMSFNYCTSQK